MSDIVTNEQSLIARSSGLKVKDYMAYALGDTGGCLAFGLVTSLLQTFYTNVFMLSPLFIMLMFTGARIWDAVNDPIMGRICDTVKVGKSGRYKIWFIIGGIPLAIATILLFVKLPGFGNADNNIGAYVYATITYIAFGMSYTMIQIPYGSLASVVTLDDKERSKLSIWRAIGAAVGSMPAILLSMLCFKKVKNETGTTVIIKYDALIIGVVIISIMSFAALVCAFLFNKERVISVPAPREKGATIKSLKVIFASRPLMAVATAAMLLLAGQMFTQGYYTYLIMYYFKEGGTFIMLPTILTYVPMALLMFFTPKLVRKFGKKEITAVGMTIATVANFAMFFLKYLPPHVAIWPFFALCFVSGIGLNCFVLQVWAMATDSIDDIEVKTGVRDDATAYSVFNFFRKLGQVISAIAVNGALLAIGFFATAEGEFVFTDGQLEMMYALATLIPAAMFGIMAICLFVWYPLSKKAVENLQVDKEAMLRKKDAMTATVEGNIAEVNE